MIGVKDYKQKLKNKFKLNDDGRNGNTFVELAQFNACGFQKMASFKTN